MIWGRLRGHTAHRCLLALALGTGGQSAFSNEDVITLPAEVPPDPPPPEKTVRVLPDIIVTTARVEKTLEDIAGSVTALDGDFIRENGAFSLVDVQNFYSNVDLRLDPVNAEFRIRGIGSNDQNQGMEPSVSSVVDGVAYGRSNFMTAVFYDIDRIEVARGPQGTLFGKNSSAGLINLVTNAPRQKFGLGLEAIYGDYGEHSLRPVINMPLTDALAVRYSGNYSDRDGVVFNTALQREEEDFRQQSSRLKLRYASGGPLRADFTAFHSAHEFNNGGFQLSRATPDMLELVQSFDPDADADATDFRTSLNFPTFGEATFTGASLNTVFDLQAALGLTSFRVTSISAWADMDREHRDFDTDFSPVPFLHDKLAGPTIYRQLSQEVQLDGHAPSLFGWGHGFDFVAGLYYQRSRFNVADLIEVEDLGAAAAYFAAANGGGQGGDGAIGQGGAIGGDVISQLIPLLDPALNPLGLGSEQSAFVQLDQRTRTLAGYVQFEQKLTDAWGLLGGLRIGREVKPGHARNELTGEFIRVLAQAEDVDARLRRDEREFSPRFGVQWQPAAAIHVYGIWARGFKSGGYNAIPLTNDNLEFDEEQANNFEAGVKARLLGGALRFSLAAFVTDFENLQLSTFRDNRFITLNAAEARSRGVEGDVEVLLPLPGASIKASVGFNDAIFTRYPEAPAQADAEEDTQDLSGRPLPFAPRWTGALVPSYSRRIGAFDVNFAADLLFRDERFLGLDLDPRTLQPATTEVNARMTLSRPLDSWQLTVALRNITNEVIWQQILDQPLAPGNFAAWRQDRGSFASVSLNWRY